MLQARAVYPRGIPPPPQLHAVPTTHVNGWPQVPDGGAGDVLIYTGGGMNYETHPPRFWENPGTQNCPTSRGGGGVGNPPSQPPVHKTRANFPSGGVSGPCVQLTFVLTTNPHNHACIILCKGSMGQNGTRNVQNKTGDTGTHPPTHPPTLIHPCGEPISTHTPKNVPPPREGWWCLDTHPPNHPPRISKAPTHPPTHPPTPPVP